MIPSGQTFLKYIKNELHGVHKQKLHVCVNGLLLSRVFVTKFLGVHMDSKLDWNDHINIVRNKIYKAFHNLLPTNRLSYFTKVNDSHTHNTRNNTLTFKVRYTRTSKKALCICVKGSKLWNALSSDINLSRNVNAFKKMLKALLLENYKF